MCFFLLLVKVMRNQYSPVKCQASFCLSQIIITSPSCQDSYNNNNNNERATVIISLWWIIKLFKHYTQHLPLKIQLWKSTQSRPASGRARTHHRNALQPSRSARGGGEYSPTHRWILYSETKHSMIQWLTEGRWSVFHFEGVKIEMADLRFFQNSWSSWLSSKLRLAPVISQRASPRRGTKRRVQHVIRALISSTQHPSLSAVYQTKPYEL